MQHIRSKDTKIEGLLRKALWKKGYRFRKNYKELPGKPDIVFTKYKIAIFCDGEFFHGKDWEVLKPRLEKSNNSEYWISKISRNKERDDEINKKLLFLGWTVIRFWGNDIKKNTDECIRVIEETIFEIKTMDDYFNLIESYNEANPTMEDGTENIPYTILCDDWRYFCLENAPMFLDGYPNDGSCMVDPETQKVMDYNTTDTAKAYFGKLNEEYKKGIVDPESFTQSYDEYISKLSSGRVLGMILSLIHI